VWNHGRHGKGTTENTENTDSESVAQNDALDLQPGLGEVHQETEPEACRSELAETLCAVDVVELAHGLELDDDGIVDNYVR
jgi:hypothetical protein